MKASSTNRIRKTSIGHEQKKSKKKRTLPRAAAAGAAAGPRLDSLPASRPASLLASMLVFPSESRRGGSHDEFSSAPHPAQPES